MEKADVQVRFGTSQGGISGRMVTVQVGGKETRHLVDARQSSMLIRFDKGAEVTLDVQDVDQLDRASPSRRLLDGFRVEVGAPCRKPVCYLEGITEAGGSVDADHSTVAVSCVPDSEPQAEPKAEPEPAPEPVKPVPRAEAAADEGLFAGGDDD